MPELPEVEVTRLGIAPHLEGRKVSAVQIIDGRLRWPVPASLTKTLPGQKVRAIDRRGKYLLLEMDTGYLLIHLGMTGTLRVLPSSDALKTHDRVTLEFGKLSLRLHDPRKFGHEHILIRESTIHLCQNSRKSKLPDWVSSPI